MLELETRVDLYSIQDEFVFTDFILFLQATMISLHAELFAEQVTQLFIANDSRRPLLAKPYKEQPVRKCAAAAGRQR